MNKIDTNTDTSNVTLLDSTLAATSSSSLRF